MNSKNKIIFGDSRKVLNKLTEQVDLIVTSPPYADARTKHYDSIHPDKYVEWFLSFHEPFMKVLKPSGSLVINIKDKIVDGVRHRYVWDTIKALSDLGWYGIDDYIWHKPNPMPGYWPTRLRDGWEYCFHLSKEKKPYINFEAVKKPIGNWSQARLANLGKNDLARHNSENRSGFGRDISKWVKKDKVLPGNVLTIPLVGKNQGHPAVFPVDLPRFFIKLLTPENGIVLDPFAGSGTTGLAAFDEKRKFILIDNNKEYCIQAKKRIKNVYDEDIEIKIIK
jgi:site-specific DNA-methyltransferase (adenine-specific)